MHTKIEEKYRCSLEKYTQLEDIRKKLWGEDGKSRVSLMIGAGFSLNASKLDPSLKSMSLWPELKTKLLHELGFEKNSSYDVLDLGDLYEKQFGIISLENLLKSEIPDENYEPNLLYEKLLELPFSDIYTTNYDTLLERASKNIFNRHYQIIYNIHDIPGSVSPRIVKLHGSFPSNRPFVFTKDSYDKYPEDSAPFINMVRQSIMETTMILIGFSGNDPNFTKWIEWVSKTLGKHRPKIYLLDLNIDESIASFSESSITGIDFAPMYESVELDNKHKIFFKELFDYLSANPNRDKRKWPYNNYPWIYSENKIDGTGLFSILKENRESYPGWLIMPYRIKNRLFIDQIVESYLPILKNEKNHELQIEIANELVWVLRTFRIPITKDMHLVFEDIIAKFECCKNRAPILNIMLFLLRDTTKSNKQNDELYYQNILWRKNKNNDEIYRETIKNWHIDDQALDYKLKKAALLLEINQVDKAIDLITEALQNARRIQSIDRQNYFALSVEGIALTLLQRYAGGKVDNEYFNRIINLEQRFCNPLITIDYISNLQRERIPARVEQKRTFDGKHITSYHIGSYGQSDLLASFFFMTVNEEYFIDIDRNHKIEVLKNFQRLYPTYSLKKFFSFGDEKTIDDFFSRELIISLSQPQIDELYVFLKNNILDDSPQKNILMFDVLFRLYFILNEDRKKELDTLLIEQYCSDKILKKLGINAKEVFEMCLNRIFQSKFSNDLICYVNMIYSLPIIGEEGTKLEKIQLDENFCFDPIDAICEKNFKDLKGKISNKQYPVSKLINYLSNPKLAYSVRVASWQRLIFLYHSGNISDQEFKQLRKKMGALIKENDLIFRHYSKSFAITNFIKDSNINKKYIEELLEKEFVEPFHGAGFSIGIALNYQLLELDNMLKTNDFSTDDYNEIVHKIDIWWKNQYELIKKFQMGVMNNNDLCNIVVFIKNSIFRLIKKEYFNKSMKDTLLSCYYSLKEDKNFLSYLLISGLIKVDIETDKLIIELKNGMLSSNNEVMKNSIYAIQDISLYKEQKEICCDVRELKLLLLQFFTVQRESSLLYVSKTIFLILKEKPNFFTKKELTTITYSVNQFFKIYVNDSNQEVFELEKLIDIVNNYLNIVELLSNMGYEVNKKQWVEWCSNSQYPEIKRFAYVLL